jgi:hypothetical protein
LGALHSPALGTQGVELRFDLVGVTTKKQLLIAPPQAIILMREVQLAKPAASEVPDDSETSGRAPALVSTR